MSGQLGTVRERELVNRLLDAGYGALRLPSSGSATTTDLPDVLAGIPTYHHHGGAIQAVTHDVYDWYRGGQEDRIRTETWAIELKSGKATTLYVNGSEVDALLGFAERWGAKAFLGARFTSQASPTATYLVTPERARGPTDSGLYGLPLADIEERAAITVTADGVER